MDFNNTTEADVTTDTPLEEIASYQAALLLPKVVLPVLVVLGVTGNLLTLVTLHSRAYGPSTTAAAFSLLAIADTCYLLGNLRWWVKAVFDADFRLVSPAACRFHQMWTYYFRHLSSCTLAFITVERAAGICFPLQWQIVFTTRKNYIVLAMLSFVLFGINLQLPFKYTVHFYDDSSSECNVYLEDDDWYNFVWIPLDEALQCFLPGAIILTGNVVIIWRLRTMPNISGEAGSRNRSITLMLVAVSVVFLLTTLPNAIFHVGDGSRIWSPEVTSQQMGDIRLAHIATVLWARVNNAVNFVLYCATGTKFREAFVATFRSRWRAGKVEAVTSGPPLLHPDPGPHADVSISPDTVDTRL